MLAKTTMRLPAVAVLGRREPVPFHLRIVGKVAWLYPGVATGVRALPVPTDTKLAPPQRVTGQAVNAPARVALPPSAPRVLRGGCAVGDQCKAA